MANVAGNPVLAFVLPWAPNFAPRSWAFCQGQLLAISQNNALFALLGTIYGGDGLPNDHVDEVGPENEQ